MTVSNFEATVSKLNKLVLEGISVLVVEQYTDAKRAKVTSKFVDLARHIRAQIRTAHGPFSKFSVPSFIANFK